MTRILFVCLGNICRSPMAEAVFLERARVRGVSGHFEADSAGTGGWHAGETPDPRTIQELARHGIPWASRARQVVAEDFRRFDHLFAMDRDNERDLLHWPGADPGRVSLLLGEHEVPDPYYGGPEGFRHVFELVSAGADAILDRLAHP